MRCLRLHGPIVCLLVVLALSTTSVAAAKVTLRFAMWSGSGGQAELDGQLALFQKYHQLNPDVSIELYQQGWTGYHEKLLTMFAGGIGPDVMVLSRIELPSFVEKGVVQPIDPWLAKESQAFKRDIVELVSGTYQKKIYGIPIWGGPALFEYNADLFDAAGLTSPINLAKNKAWTWDTYLNFGRKITRDANGDGIMDVFMHAKLSTVPRDWYIKLRAFGGDMLDDNGKPNTNVETLQKALQFWQDMAWQYHIAPVGKETSNFTKGTEATYMTWLSEAPNHFKNINGTFKPELVTPPSGPAGLFTLVGGCPIVISSSTPYAAEAYEFSRWYAMESGHWKLRGTPADWSTMKSDYRAYLSTMYSWPDAVVESMQGAVSMEPGVSPQYNDLNQGWNTILSAVAANTMSAREAATRMIAHTQIVLKNK